LPVAGALIAHQTPFFASAHLGVDDEIADHAESEHPPNFLLNNHK
jgi:hypothetical protein